jgi:hypothetical protein
MNRVDSATIDIDEGTTEEMIHSWSSQMINAFAAKNHSIKETRKLVIFFDEINTMHCKLFLMTLLLDRIIDIATIPPSSNSFVKALLMRMLKEVFNVGFFTPDHKHVNIQFVLELRKLVHKV